MGGFGISTENMSSLEVSLSAHCPIQCSPDSEGFEVSLPSPTEELSGRHPEMFPLPVRMTWKKAGKKISAGALETTFFGDCSALPFGDRFAPRPSWGLAQNRVGHSLFQ